MKYLLAATFVSACIASSVAMAAESARKSLQLSVKIPLTCKVEFDGAASLSASGNKIFTVNELCNGNISYDIVLRHAPLTDAKIIYNGVTVSKIGADETILARRAGPYRGNRVLEIDGQNVALRGVVVRMSGAAI